MSCYRPLPSGSSSNLCVLRRNRSVTTDYVLVGRRYGFWTLLLLPQHSSRSSSSSALSVTTQRHSGQRPNARARLPHSTHTQHTAPWTPHTAPGRPRWVGRKLNTLPSGERSAESATHPTAPATTSTHAYKPPRERTHTHVQAQAAMPKCLRSARQCTFASLRIFRMFIVCVAPAPPCCPSLIWPPPACS